MGTTPKIVYSIEVETHASIQIMEFTVTRLKRRGPRKGETMQRNSQHGRGQAIGSVSGSDSQNASHAVGGGKGLTITRQVGIGSRMVKDLEGTVKRAKEQYRADRIAAARDRLADRQAHSHLACRF
jgi:hypothetical protein